ncbi:hypothetical protein [uncultured Lacinutrix sp.]|uniref:hypothetical protein n=1 Tax=uncultured Lacinutrix sp. TaxID=574032 RepID=UPI002630AB90|nr:hypothetical protein [uncultured Lacinutrix sp.]
MKTSTCSDILFQFLSHKLKENKKNNNYNLPIELLDLCIIIQWRYKKLNRNLKRHKVEQNQLLHLKNNAIISIYNNSILDPIIIEKNIAIDNNPLKWYFYFHDNTNLFKSKDKNEALAEFLYLICFNPLIISNHKQLISLIVKIANRAKINRTNNYKLRCLKVVNSETNCCIFPVELMEVQYEDTNVFQVKYFSGNVADLKPKKKPFWR